MPIPTETATMFRQLDQGAQFLNALVGIYNAADVAVWVETITGLMIAAGVEPTLARRTAYGVAENLESIGAPGSHGARIARDLAAAARGIRNCEKVTAEAAANPGRGPGYIISTP